MKIQLLKKILAVNLIIASCFVFSANAGVISSQLLVETPTNTAPIASSIDVWQFNLAEQGDIALNILSWEYDAINDALIDVNGDGEFNFFDSFIWLFDASGQVITFNDDSNLVSAGGDGSLDGNYQDSYLQGFNLNVGLYTVVVGMSDWIYWNDPEAAYQALDLDNKVQNGGYLVSYQNGFYQDSDSSYIAYDPNIQQASYQLTYSDNLTLVNAPTHFSAFFALALLFVSRRKAQ